MKYLTTAVITFFITLTPYLTTYAQEIIPIKVSERGHLMLRASVNGIEGNFIFDTGAGIHVVSDRFFQKVKQHVVDSSYFSAWRHTGERLDGPLYKFNNVSLGPLRQQHPWIGVYKGFDEMGFDGLISAKLIEDEIITVDPKARYMIVETLSSIGQKAKKEIPILLHSDRGRSLDFFITVKVQEKYDAVMEFDTGAGYSPLYIHSRYMHYVGIDTTQLEIRQSGTGFGNREKTYFDKTKTVNISVPGTNEGGKPNIVYKPSLIYDGLTSYIIFGDKAWSIDIQNKKMYLLE